MTAYSHFPELTEDGTLYVNNSSLSYLASCEAKAHLHGLHLTSADESVRMFAGECAHVFFAQYFQGDETPVLPPRYREYADLNLDPNGADAAYTYNNLADILEYWQDRFVRDGLILRIKSSRNPVCRLMPTAVEIPFEFPLTDDGLIFRGRLDALVEDMSGHIRVVDHKTTGGLNKMFVEKFRVDSQFSGYVWATEQHLRSVEGSKAVCLGGVVNAVEFRKLPEDLDRKCGVHKTPYRECRPAHVNAEMFTVDRTPEQLKEWKKTAVQLARRYRELLLAYPDVEDIPRVRTQGTFHGACAFCFAKEFCAGGRPVALVGSMFQREEREPGEEG